MRGFYFDPRDLQQFQNVAETVVERLGEIFHETNKGVKVEHNAPASQIRLDVAEDDERFYVYAELPGVHKEDVKVSMSEDTVLTIKAEKRRPEGEELKFSRVERGYGSLSRSVTLTEQVQQEQISAEFRDGVLSITLPKLVPVSKEFKVHIQ